MEQEPQAATRCGGLEIAKDIATISAPVVALVIFLVGIWQWNSDQSKARALARFEAQKPYLTKQLESYHTTMKVIGQIATTDLSSTKWHEIAPLVWAESYGAIAVFADSSVQKSLEEFRSEMLNWKSFEGKSDEFKALLMKKAKIVGEKMQKSISTSWNIEF
jgi:hypothetical protein